MRCPIFPALEGAALQRFHALARQVMQQQRSGSLARFDELCESEVRWATGQTALNGSAERYEACARVLIDLAKLRWKIQEDRFGFELVSPRGGGFTSQQVSEYKAAVRAELAPQIRAQFTEPSAVKFIRQMEQPPAKGGRKSILNLIADGRELRARTIEASEASGEARLELLRQSIQPYIQLVEPGAVDHFTGIPLRDVWRYFRYTWTIPATNIPGRQLWYLVRDGGHPQHAVMGIAGLSNAPLQLKDRDHALGWSAEAFEQEVLVALSSGQTQPLRDLIDQLESNVTRAVSEIDPTNLVTAAAIQSPTPDIIAALRRRAAEYKEAREDILSNIVSDAPLRLEELEQTDYSDPPVSAEVLALEGKVAGDLKVDSGRRALIAKKRAGELARLLHARLIFRLNKERFCEPKTTRDALATEEFSAAVETAILAVKHERAGTNILELTTCGSIPPYNVLLGGKLVALLMLSPEVAADYRRRYGNEPSIISSLMKNALVRKDSRLVFLGTTSLYTHGASQYNRLRLPKGIVAPDQEEIRFEMLGRTSGFGTLQFPEGTMRAVERVLEQHQGFRDVNSIFGEGRSPKLRKLRAGLQLLGYDPSAVLQHHQPRCIYGACLSQQTVPFLNGKTDTLSSYVEAPNDFRSATAGIVEFWRKRWLASRLNYAPALATLSETHAWRLSESLPAEDPKQASTSSSASVSTPVGAEASSLRLWKSLAQAGHDVCSDELSDEDVGRLHVTTTLEDFIVRKAEQGFSVVLTGNAGDGKTHLLRRLAPSLERAGAIVEPDATAVMRGDSVVAVLDRWKGALKAKKPYCLAANEYPLYQLRKQGRKHLPILTEVDRQCRHRLAYGPVSDSEDEHDRVIVVDLSLRNPLARQFAGDALSKLLSEPAVKVEAASPAVSALGWNYRHLSNPQVQDRILSLFDRLASRGYRASIRELWIVLARLLFDSSGDEGDPNLSPRKWYSEKLFESDERFHLVGLLRRFADPALCSHPRWDRRIEEADGTTGSDWVVDGQVPPIDRRALDRMHFAALKRRFYFEHAFGSEAFALEPVDAGEFLKLLTEAGSPDDVFKQKIITAINRSYCPKLFDGSNQNLYLWTGHRFHEQPSRAFLANQSIAATEFSVHTPRLPRRLEGALTYRPDHLVFEHASGDDACRLRIDYPLYVTLSKLAAGFPRHLAAERDLNRLDAFVDALKSHEPQPQRQFVVFSSENRAVSRITLSPDYAKYVEVEEL